MLIQLAVVWLGVLGAANTQCVNEQGQSVDWFVMLKMPGGYNYFYADAVNETLVEGSSELQNENNPVARTVSKIYKHDNSNWFMYNDQVPRAKPVMNRGHTKGVVQWDTESLTWLVHSAPNFPPKHEEGYSYPESAERFGQSFLCFTVSTPSGLPKVANQLLYSWPKIYDYQVDIEYRKKYEDLNEVLSGKHIKNYPWFSIEVFETLKKKAITSFSKFDPFDDDLYKGLVGPTFGVNLYTETWQNGRDPLPSNCTGKYFVKNIHGMKLENGPDYHSSQDHSKWTISEDHRKPFICIGGINRMLAQTTRGGGTFCLNSEILWGNVNQGITNVEECQ